VLGVSIDTRSLEPGSLFVALRGATIDGHNYLAQAADLDAAAAIVETGRRHPALGCIEVDDTLAALGRLAHAHLARRRAARPLPVIAIGGAVGKTTTKELTAAVTRALFGATLSTPGNLNNLIGVPMTIFTLIGEHNAAVLECGTNTRGEIPKLARIVEPDVAMVLNVDLELSANRPTPACASPIAVSALTRGSESNSTPSWFLPASSHSWKQKSRCSVKLPR
jgi:UDP-N-acetylmuramyl pentapeptide synthase